MYHVTGTITVATLLYLISFYFYRTSFYTISFHKKLWNVILAGVFLTTAIAGIFLALQINYKWDVGFTKAILKWHVEFGIGMAIIGLFHFIWHFSYYKSILTSQQQQGAGRKRQGAQSESDSQYKGKNIPASLFVIGFVSSAVQLLFLREIMNITGGYELISGVFFGSWLITSAAGSAVAGRSTLSDTRKLLLTFSFSPVISLFLMLFLWRIFMISGQTPTFLESFIYTLLVIGPFCFVSGFTFVRFLEIARNEYVIPGRSFSIETFGGVIAGIFISIISAGVLNTYESLLLVILLSITFALLSSFSFNRRKIFTVKILTVLLVIIILDKNTDLFFRRILLPGINVVSTKDTPYGNITAATIGGEKSIFYNQRLLRFTDDAIQREEDIHYAMLQDDNPQTVLVVSGSLRSHLTELSKYPVRKVTFIERDPSLIDSLEGTSGSSMIETVISVDDAYSFVNETKNTFDVILLLVPPPSTLLLNRYYTTEFFMSARKKLTEGGIFLCSPGNAENYYNKESLLVCSSVYNSLKKVFRNVLPIVGNKLYFVASDKELSPAISALSVQKGIQNLYVGPDYLSDDLIRAKSIETAGLMDAGTKENTLSLPVACMGFQSLIFNMKAGEKIPSLILVIFIFALPLIAISRRSFTMYTGAFSLAGFEIILLLSLQLSVGNMYQVTGLILASVMSGLAAGALLEFKLPGRLPSKSKILLLGLTYLLTIPFLSFIRDINNHIIIIILLLIMAFIPGVVTGNLFRELTKSKAESVSGVYSSDLAGSAAGFILISAVAVPVVGITVSVFLLAIINFAGFLFGTAPANE